MTSTTFYDFMRRNKAVFGVEIGVMNFSCLCLCLCVCAVMLVP